MLCQECNERPATLQFTKVINGKKAEVNLCEHCAAEKGDIFMLHDGGNLSFNNLLAGLLNMGLGMTSTKASPGFGGDQLECPHCHLTYREFVNSGRFGCRQCYETFAPYLEPVLSRLHGGNVNHTGKIPKRAGGTLHIRKQINDLKADLQALIEQEDFEKAVHVRDEIRQLEKEIEAASQEGGGEG
ncbi:Modulator of heat shock repressor CtsR, McsA [Bacillus sp. FJAT-27916]|uniref:UvrB/UvrC motif-containing protein n=1 Tax=Bacillus sp. FJAT-27916 TaxID=1679169 RepID=UPI000670E0A1|nr:UvrB/UvrC motif-containing protein [Bacillus sp. FJAT-27916]KMY46131.1 Modulator of heat shock repressor CtsR, McsA [Bacillus sp. FJAT-27916]